MPQLTFGQSLSCETFNQTNRPKLKIQQRRRRRQKKEEEGEEEEAASATTHRAGGEAIFVFAIIMNQQSQVPRT